ncbi:unnamed protein product [Heligmosomoides polygyrus]|uniref:VWFA domain-containing protein n=1 Tax=Heligmosomoides polygyrus TaxID=6339 RepID=A0A3P7Z322_HELPZ|nr:unnamed protein product [Heligmosomoides polygyrus]
MKHWAKFVCFLLAFVQTVVAQPGDDEICAPVIDMAFVLDTSGSIDEIHNEQVRWIVALANAMPINKDAVRISTTQYASYPLTEFSLDTYHDKDDVVRHLRKMSFQSGVTRTGAALRSAEDQLFNEDTGARRCVIDVSQGVFGFKRRVADITQRASGLRRHLADSIQQESGFRTGVADVAQTAFRLRSHLTDFFDRFRRRVTDVV